MVPLLFFISTYVVVADVVTAVREIVVQMGVTAVVLDKVRRRGSGW